MLRSEEAARPPAPPGAEQHLSTGPAAAAAILYVFLWASGFVPARVVARSPSLLALLSLRFVAAGGLLLVYARAQGEAWPRGGRAFRQLLLLGVLGNALGLGFTWAALRHLSAGMASIVGATNPLVLAVLAPRFLKEPLTARKVTGLLLGFAGVVVAMQARTGTRTASLEGVLLLLCGVLSIVAATIYYKRMDARPAPLMLNGAQLLLGGLVLVPAFLVLEGPPQVAWDLPMALSMAWFIVALSILSPLLWFWILRRGEASRVSAFHFLTPAFGLLLGAALLGERLLPLDALGLCFIASGLWIVSRG